MRGATTGSSQQQQLGSRSLLAFLLHVNVAFLRAPYCSTAFFVITKGEADWLWSPQTDCKGLGVELFKMDAQGFTVSALELPRRVLSP